MATIKEKTFDLGVIRYRMPNIVETMRLLGQLGFDMKGGGPEEGQELQFVSSLVEHMQPFIVEIAAKKDEKDITDWEEALEHMEFMPALTAIAGELLDHITPRKKQEAERKN